jgi:hypothetical protein
MQGGAPEVLPFEAVDTLAAMADVYVDEAVVAGSGARAHLEHLVDAGHRLVVIGSIRNDDTLVMPGVPRLDRMPADPPRGSWFVTADPDRCSERVVGVRTLLIGPRVGRSPARGPRCDTEARDLAAAVLAILTHDAMGG